MSTTMIPDSELIAEADVVTVWVATPNAPTDVWSLTEAIAWIVSQPDRTKITLFRAPDKSLRAAWLKPDQIERLACALLTEPTAS